MIKKSPLKFLLEIVDKERIYHSADVKLSFLKNFALYHMI